MFRRSPLGILLSAAIGLGVFGFGGYKIINAIGGATEGIKQGGGDTSSGGGDDDSLFKEANFAKALDAVRGKIGVEGQLFEIRVEPKKANFTVRKDQEAAAEGLSFNDGELEDFDVDLTGPGRTEDNVFALAKVPPGVTERLTSKVTRKADVTPDDVQFMRLTIDASSGKPQWSVNVLSGERGGLYLADIDGGGLERPGERATRGIPRSKGSGGGSTPRVPKAPTAGDVQKYSDCVQSAGADASRIQACQKYLR